MIATSTSGSTKPGHVFQLFKNINPKGVQEAWKKVDEFSRKDSAMRGAGKLPPGMAWRILKTTVELIAESK